MAFEDPWFIATLGWASAIMLVSAYYIIVLAGEIKEENFNE